MYLSNTTLFDGRDMYRIYYIKNNYMFWHLTLAIFRLRNKKKNLVSSYTRLMGVVYSGEVRGEVAKRSRMCYVRWVVWVHGVLLLYGWCGYMGFCYCMGGVGTWGSAIVWVVWVHGVLLLYAMSRLTL